jgi:hypothetical protein
MDRICSVKCPSCNEEALVKRSESLYQCLYCDYRRSFSGSGPENDIPIVLLAAPIVIFVLIFHDAYANSLTQPSSTNELQPSISMVEDNP